MFPTGKPRLAAAVTLRLYASCAQSASSLASGGTGTFASDKPAEACTSSTDMLTGIIAPTRHPPCIASSSLR